LYNNFNFLVSLKRMRQTQKSIHEIEYKSLQRDRKKIEKRNKLNYDDDAY
jgi:hypothetical protein